MTKAIPQVQSFMTTCPHTVGIDQPLSVAEELMKKYHIRHLPVLEGGTLTGIITDRDIKLCRDFIDGDNASVKVGDVCEEAVYTVSPSSPLNEVVTGMAEGKFGSSVVVDHGKVVGIFTSIDVMIALATLLETRLKADHRG